MPYADSRLDSRLARNVVCVPLELDCEIQEALNGRLLPARYYAQVANRWSTRSDVLTLQERCAAEW